ARAITMRTDKPELPYNDLKVEMLPRDIKEMFEYHPDKAKELLTEAGTTNDQIIYTQPLHSMNLSMVDDPYINERLG
ncbi:hypothetical protein ACFLTY_05635, partial [Chloroflexota bacterium]